MSAIAYHEPYRLPAGILAVAVHGIFFALLYFGFAWQAQPAGTMSVELWQSLPDMVAAPPAQPIIKEAPPEPEPEPEPEPAPEPEPEPEKIIEPEAAPPQPEKMVEPEIALPDEKKPVPEPEKEKAEKEKAEKEKAEKEKAEKEKAEKEKAEKEKAKKEKAKAEKARKAAEAAERAARERAEEAARVRAEREAAIGRVVDEHIAKIVRKVRRNIVMPPDVAEDARAEFLVTLLPGGSVLRVKLARSSGNAVYDNAVERAILKSQPLPLPADGLLFNKFRKLKLVFKPVE